MTARTRSLPRRRRRDYRLGAFAPGRELDAARKGDVEQGIDTPQNMGLRDRAIQHITEAQRHLHHLIEMGSSKAPDREATNFPLTKRPAVRWPFVVLGACCRIMSARWKGDAHAGHLAFATPASKAQEKIP